VAVLNHFKWHALNHFGQFLLLVPKYSITLENLMKHSKQKLSWVVYQVSIQENSYAVCKQ
jgi:hypothetical protein